MGFKRSVYWNKDKIIFEDYNNDEYIRQRIDASFQGVNKLFVLAFARGNNITNESSYRKYFLPRNYFLAADLSKKKSFGCRS